MSTSDILNEMRVNIQKAYLKAEEKGATMPEQKNLQNLEATIESITGGGTTTLEKYYVTQVINGDECELQLMSTNNANATELLVGQYIVGNDCKLYLMEE